MIKLRSSFFFSAILFLLIWSWIGIPYCHTQPVPGQAVTDGLQEQQEPEKIIGSTKDVKQKTGIWVFVAWMWISILVLIFFLRLKIKEADRLFHLRFYSAKKN